MRPGSYKRGDSGLSINIYIEYFQACMSKYFLFKLVQNNCAFCNVPRTPSHAAHRYSVVQGFTIVRAATLAECFLLFCLQTIIVINKQNSKSLILSIYLFILNLLIKKSVKNSEKLGNSEVFFSERKEAFLEYKVKLHSCYFIKSQ